MKHSSFTLKALAFFSTCLMPFIGQAASDDWKDFTNSAAQNWSAGGSWVDGSAPVTNDPTLVINFNPSLPGTTTSGGGISTSFTSNNDLGTVQLNQLNLAGQSNAGNTVRIVTISGGTLNFLGSNAAITVTNGPSANLPISYQISSALNLGTNLTLDTTGVNNSGNFGTVLGGAITLGGNTLTLKSKSTATALTTAGAISVSGGTISGAGTIAVEGGFTIISSAASSFTGNLEVRSGMLSLGTSNLLGSGNTVAVNSGGSLGLGNNNHTWGGLNDGTTGGGAIGMFANSLRSLTLAGSGSYSFSGQILDRVGTPGATSQLALTVALGTGGVQKLSGANAYTGVTTLTSGTLEVTSLANGGTSTTAAAAAALGSSQLQLASVSGLTVGQTITANGIAAGTTITAIDTGTNTVTLSTATIAAISSGATTVTGTANSLGLSTNAATNLILTSGSTLKYTGSGSSTDRLFRLSGGNASTFTIDSSGTGAVAFTNTGSIEHANSNVTRTLVLTGTNTDNNSMAAVITNSGTAVTSLTKSGAGKWILAGANTFGGATTVNAGTLIVGNSVSSSYNSAITVNAGTVGGLGNSSKNVTIGNGTGGNDAFISPGDGGIGTFATTGSMSLLADAVFRFELRGNGTPAADVLQASSVSINSSALFSFTLLGDVSGLVVGQTFTIINNTGVADISGGFSNLTAGGIYNAGSGLTFSVSGGAGSYGNDLVLTVATVPEPGTVALVTLAGLSAVLLRRRKNPAA